MSPPIYLKVLTDLLGWLLLSAVCLVASGCSKSAGPPKVEKLPVKGVVTLDGQPLAGARVTFLPKEAGGAAAGRTNESGAYELEGMAGRSSALQGPCKVTISRMLKPDGSPPAPNEAPMAVGAQESLPKQYSMPGSTTLSADVPAGGGTFDFPLKSK